MQLSVRRFGVGPRKEALMKNHVSALTAFALLGLLLVGCQTEPVQTRPFEMTSADVGLDWGIT